MNLEDQINQLFSSIIQESRSLSTCRYEGETFVLGTGPIKSSSHQTGGLEAILDGQMSILGAGHPLVVKSLLLAAIEDQGYASSEEVDSFTQDLEIFLNKFLPDVKVAIGVAWGPQRKDLGREVDFFSLEAKNTLKKNDFFHSANFLPMPMSLSLSKKLPASHPVYVSRSDLRLATALLKLIKLGGIYGANGAIEKKEALLEKFFCSLGLAVEVHGLIVEVGTKVTEPRIKVGSDNRLYFPFLFDENLLETLGTLLAKK